MPPRCAIPPISVLLLLVTLLLATVLLPHLLCGILYSNLLDNAITYPMFSQDGNACTEDSCDPATGGNKLFKLTAKYSLLCFRLQV